MFSGLLAQSWKSRARAQRYRTGSPVQWLKLSAWKVGDRAFEPHSGLKWNESGFRPPLCTYRLNWARRTSWGWWDDWDDTVLQTQDSKFDPWRSEAEHATSRSRRLPTILTQEIMKAKTFRYNLKRTWRRSRTQLDRSCYISATCATEWWQSKIEIFSWSYFRKFGQSSSSMELWPQRNKETKLFFPAHS